MGAVSQAQEWWLHQPDGEAQLQARLRCVPSSAWQHVRQERVRLLLTKPGSIKEPGALAAWHEALQDLGLEN